MVIPMTCMACEFIMVCAPSTFFFFSVLYLPLAPPHWTVSTMLTISIVVEQVHAPAFGTGPMLALVLLTIPYRC